MRYIPVEPPPFFRDVQQSSVQHVNDDVGTLLEDTRNTVDMALSPVNQDTHQVSGDLPNLT